MTTNPHTVRSLDERKLDVELAKLDLEQKKYDMLRWGYYVDIIGKLAIPFGLAGIAWATYVTNTNHTSDRMAFDVDSKRKELRLKEEDLFLKKSDTERQRDLIKSGFIQNNFALITSSSPESEQRVTALAKAVFSAREAEDVLSKVAQIRLSSPQATSASRNSSPLTPAEYKAIGRKFVQIGNFEQASLNFETVTLLNASDAEAWNFKAYAEMRNNRNDAAFKSIGMAINLRPSDGNLQNLMMLNATKILCSMGRNSDAVSYINQSIAYAPALLGIAQNDLELQQRCGFTFGRKQSG